jgi:hypothetical protein
MAGSDPPNQPPSPLPFQAGDAAEPGFVSAYHIARCKIDGSAIDARPHDESMEGLACWCVPRLAVVCPECGGTKQVRNAEGAIGDAADGCWCCDAHGLRTVDLEELTVDEDAVVIVIHRYGDDQDMAASHAVFDRNKDGLLADAAKDREARKRKIEEVEAAGETVHGIELEPELEVEGEQECREEIAQRQEQVQETGAPVPEPDPEPDRSVSRRRHRRSPRQRPSRSPDPHPPLSMSQIPDSM